MIAIMEEILYGMSNDERPVDTGNIIDKQTPDMDLGDVEFLVNSIIDLARDFNQSESILKAIKGNPNHDSLSYRLSEAKDTINNLAKVAQRIKGIPINQRIK